MSVRSTIDNSIYRCALAEDGRSTGSSRKFTRNMRKRLSDSCACIL